MNHAFPHRFFFIDKMIVKEGTPKTNGQDANDMLGLTVKVQPIELLHRSR